MISSSTKEPIHEIAQGILLGAQFQQFIPEVAKLETTRDVQRPSPPHDDVHLEEVDLTYPQDGVGTSQGTGSSQYHSPPLLERYTNASFFRRRSKRPLQLERVQGEDED